MKNTLFFLHFIFFSKSKRILLFLYSLCIVTAGSYLHAATIGTGATTGGAWVGNTITISAGGNIQASEIVSRLATGSVTITVNDDLSLATALTAINAGTARTLTIIVTGSFTSNQTINLSGNNGAAGNTNPGSPGHSLVINAQAVNITGAISTNGGTGGGTSGNNVSGGAGAAAGNVTISGVTGVNIGANINAYGGVGGTATGNNSNGGNGGAGGNISITSSVGALTLSAQLLAYGGAGGTGRGSSNNGGNGGAGGAVNIDVTGAVTMSGSATARAYGGAGGTNSSNSARGGNGGNGGCIKMKAASYNGSSTKPVTSLNTYIPNSNPGVAYPGTGSGNGAAGSPTCNGAPPTNYDHYYASTPNAGFQINVAAVVCASPLGVAMTSPKQTYCQGETSTSSPITAIPALGTPPFIFTWYSNTTSSNTGGTLVASGIGMSTYAPPTSTPGTTYYYVEVTSGPGCSIAKSAIVPAATITVNGSPSAVLSYTETGSATKLEWDPPVGGGAISSYRVYSCGTNASCTSSSLVSVQTATSYNNPLPDTYYRVETVFASTCTSLSNIVSDYREPPVMAEGCIGSGQAKNGSYTFDYSYKFTSTTQTSMNVELDITTNIPSPSFQIASNNCSPQSPAGYCGISTGTTSTTFTTSAGGFVSFYIYAAGAGGIAVQSEAFSIAVNGCFLKKIEAASASDPSITGTTFCEGSDVILTASGPNFGSSVKWYKGGSGSNDLIASSNETTITMPWGVGETVTYTARGSSGEETITLTAKFCCTNVGEMAEVFSERFTNDLSWTGCATRASLPTTGIHGTTTYQYVSACGSGPTNGVPDGRYAIVRTSYNGGHWGGPGYPTPPFKPEVLEHTRQLPEFALNIDNFATKNANSAALLINADDRAGTFYTLNLTGLCPNTTYEFSAWYVSLGYANEETPNISFQIVGTGVNISESTGEVPNDFTWKEKKITFDTPPNATGTYTLRLVNNKNSTANGNDLMIDDIVVSRCVPTVLSLETGTEAKTVRTCSDAPVTIGNFSATPLGSLLCSVPGCDLYYQWMKSDISERGPWTSVGSPTTIDSITVIPPTLIPPALTATEWYRVKISESPIRAAAINDPLSEPGQCYVDAISDFFTLVRVDTLEISVTPIDTLCAGDNISIEGITNGDEWAWVKHQNGIDTDTVGITWLTDTDPQTFTNNGQPAKAEDSGTYYFVARIGNCSGYISVDVVVESCDSLTLTKTVDKDEVCQGENVTFTIAINNPGATAANNLIITDLLPSGFTYVSNTRTSGVYTFGTGVWDIGTLPGNDASDTLRIVAEATGSGSIMNRAYVSSVNLGTLQTFGSFALAELKDSAEVVINETNIDMPLIDPDDYTVCEGDAFPIDTPEVTGDVADEGWLLADDPLPENWTTPFNPATPMTLDTPGVVKTIQIVYFAEDECGVRHYTNTVLIKVGPKPKTAPIYHE